MIQFNDLELSTIVAQANAEALKYKENFKRARELSRCSVTGNQPLDDIIVE
jgi:hypothetical protein